MDGWGCCAAMGLPGQVIGGVVPLMAVNQPTKRRVGVGGFEGCLPSNEGSEGAASCFEESDPGEVGFSEW